MDNHKIIRISSIVVGVLVSILIIFFGFKIIQNLFTRAEDVVPRDVVVSEIGQNSAKLSWATGEDTAAVVEYGTSPTALNFFAPESQKTQNHSLDLTLLSPGTTYYFDIRIAEKKYDNGGVPWTFSTKGIEKNQPASGSTTEEVKPTPIPTKSGPTPIQRIEINSGSSSCNETDCEKIKQKLGQGCDTQDYYKCIKKLTPTITPRP